MNNELLNEIIRFAMTRKSILEKALYLLKGFFFIPFLKTAFRKARGDEAVSLTSEAGDDIYPLF